MTEAEAFRQGITKLRSARDDGPFTGARIFTPSEAEALLRALERLDRLEPVAQELLAACKPKYAVYGPGRRLAQMILGLPVEKDE